MFAKLSDYCLATNLEISILNEFLIFILISLDVDFLLIVELLLLWKSFLLFTPFTLVSFEINLIPTIDYFLFSLNDPLRDVYLEAFLDYTFDVLGLLNLVECIVPKAVDFKRYVVYRN